MRTTLAVACLLATFAVMADEPAGKPGPTADGGFRLPNGWVITPVGRQVVLTDLPLNIIPLADGRHALAACSGYNQHELALIDLESAQIRSKEIVKQSWFGLATNPKQEKVWWSGGGSGVLHTYDLAGEKLSRTSPSEKDPVKGEDGVPNPVSTGKFPAGLTLGRDGVTLF